MDGLQTMDEQVVNPRQGREDARRPGARSTRPPLLLKRETRKRERKRGVVDGFLIARIEYHVSERKSWTDC